MRGTPPGSGSPLARRGVTPLPTGAADVGVLTTLLATLAGE
jgi:hypothetical protein